MTRVAPVTGRDAKETNPGTEHASPGNPVPNI
jgi:hypothetical protein